MDKRIEQGVKHLKEAEKHMKTSFTKWKPDPDSAAAEYMKAGVAFRNGEALEQCKSAYEKAADCQVMSKQMFHAAKSLEQAAFAAKDLKQFGDAARLIETASNMYLENGTPDTAALALIRAGKIVEEAEPSRAVHLYTKAATTYENEDRFGKAADAIKPASRLLIRNKRYDEAVTALQLEMNYMAQADSMQMVHRLVLCMVLLHVYRGDNVAADKASKHAFGYIGFADSDESTAIEKLLDALNSGDNVAASTCLNLPIFKYLDNAFACLARDMRTNPPERIAPPGGDEDEEEDEYAGGLC